MAASYFGKYDNQAQAQQALDQGKLLAPFVAMWDDQVHYNDLEETPDGEIGTEAYTGVPATGFTDNTYITAGSLYWLVADTPEWVSVSSKKGYGDSSLDVTIGENSETSIRNGSFVVKFFYDSDREYLRNEVTVTIEQDAAEEPSTGATVTLSNSQLGSYSSWQYLQVSDADGLYWAAVPPEWINNGEGFNSEGNNAWWFEVPENATQDREGTFNVEFYSDAAHENYLFSEEAQISQQGRGEYAPSFNGDYYVPSTSVSYESGQTIVYIIDNPGYAFQVLVDSYEVTGTSSTTAVYISYDENDNYNQQNKTVTVVFYEDEQLTQAVDTKYLSINQEGNPDAMFVEWEGGDSTFPASGGSRNFEIFFDNPDTTQYAISLDSGIGHFNWGGGSVTSFTANTADVATGVTFFAQANTGSTPIYGSIGVTALDANDQQIGNYPLSFTIQEQQPIVSAVCTFITSQADETQNIYPYDGGNWMSAYVDGDPSNTVQPHESTYTFGSAGTHTITYLRESTDTNLQGWLQNCDMVECSISCDTTWGMWGSEQPSINSELFSGCTNLTSVTFDQNCTMIGDTAFIDCTALTVINCYATTAPSMSGSGPISTITANTGTMHIPSGSTYTDWSTALGNNWTVVDDL